MWLALAIVATVATAFAHALDRCRHVWCSKPTGEAKCLKCDRVRETRR